MIFAELVFALAIALFLTLIYTAVVRRVKSKLRILVFFSLVFLAAWAGGIWITPAGPKFLGIYWLSFLVIGLLFALLFEVITGLSQPRRLPEKDVIRVAEEIQSELSLSFFILFVAFVILIVIGYIHRLK
jgi:cytochrome bd-type quinol oxidase subunit 2